MRVVHKLSFIVLATGLVTFAQTAGAQRGRSERDDDVRRSRENVEYGDWDDDARRRGRNDDIRPGRRRGQDDDWLRRQRAQREEWCRRHRNDRRCDDFSRRGNNTGNWCWDTNRDGRCDNIDNRRRDARGVLRSGDRGPEWERWLRANGLDLGATVPNLVPR